jgi:hypothetical protein
MSDARKRLDAMLDELEPDAVASVAYLADRLLVGQRVLGYFGRYYPVSLSSSSKRTPRRQPKRACPASTRGSSGAP